MPRSSNTKDGVAIAIWLATIQDRISDSRSLHRIQTVVMLTGSAVGHLDSADGEDKRP